MGPNDAVRISLRVDALEVKLLVLFVRHRHGFHRRADQSVRHLFTVKEPSDFFDGVTFSFDDAEPREDDETCIHDEVDCVVFPS